MDASKRVWEEYHTKLRAFIQRRVSDDMSADDVLQNVFLKIHTGLSSLKDEKRLQGWLYRIARNAIVDYYRSQRLNLGSFQSFKQTEKDPNEQVAQELSECLQPMIQRLPEIYREAVTLSELKGLTQKEVARVQGITTSGAKSRVQRGRAILKEMLGDCCRLEFDYSGRLYDYERNGGSCDGFC